MNRESKTGGAGKAGRERHILRFTLAGTTVGLAVGLYEAGLLYTTPRMPTLLQPDVRYVIWFLAPLCGLSVFSFLGAFLGAAAAVGKRPHPWRTAILAAMGLGAAGFYAALAVGLSQLWVLDRLAPRSLLMPGASFLTIFASVLLILRITQRQPGRFLRALKSCSPVSLAKALLVAIAVCVTGLALYVALRSTRRISRPPAPSEPKHGPNIVLIVLDTVRASQLSSYGYSRPTTPNIDRLARQGVLFENAIAPSSWTLPSDASILTGLLPHQHGANWSMPIAPELQTLAENLAPHAYETAGFNANLAYGLAGWGLGQGFEVYEDDSSSLRHNLASTLAGRLLIQPVYEHLIHSNSFDRRTASDVNQEVFRWFRRRSARPYFLFVNYFDAHYPYIAPPPFHRRFGQVREAIIHRAANFEYRGGVPTPLLAEREWVITAYDNCLAYLDDQVGKLVEVLARSPDWPNTVVIITSDHGEALGEHDAYGHGMNLYREVTHVPLILVGPGIPAGLRVSHIARTRELFQTVIDMVSSPSLHLERSSLRRFWTPQFKPAGADDMAVSELLSVTSLTTPEWHYHFYADGRSELYHWPTDPLEQNDLSLKAEYRPTLEDLQRLLTRRLMTSIAPWRGEGYLLGFRQPEFRSLLGERAALSQSTFRSKVSSSKAGPSLEEEEMLNNLPYH